MHTRLIVLLTAIAFYQATPSVAQQQQAAPTAASSSSTSSSSSDSTRPTETVRVTTGKLTLSEKKLIAQGYKLVIQNGVRFFCRYQAPLGTRFEHNVCRTENQLTLLRETSQDAYAQHLWLGPQVH
jgi:hypothetical protein